MWGEYDNAACNNYNSRVNCLVSAGNFSQIDLQSGKYNLTNQVGYPSVYKIPIRRKVEVISWLKDSHQSQKVVRLLEGFFVTYLGSYLKGFGTLMLQYRLHCLNWSEYWYDLEFKCYPFFVNWCFMRLTNKLITILLRLFAAVIQSRIVSL